MTTVEVERQKTISELIKFKKSFPLGFRGIFGHRVTTIKESIKEKIEGLLTPVRNEFNDLTADFIKEAGLRDVVTEITEWIDDIEALVTGPDGLGPLLDVLKPIVDAVTLVVTTFFGWVSDIWDMLADALNIIPPEVLMDIQDPNVGGGGTLPPEPLIDGVGGDYPGFRWDPVTGQWVPDILGGGGDTPPFQFH